MKHVALACASAGWIALALGGCGAEPAATPAPDEEAAAPDSAALPAPPAPARSAPTADASSRTAAPADQPKLAVDGEGLRWFLPPNGSARPLAFGMPQAAVLASLERVRGEAAKGVNRDCGAGPVETATWADGLSLVFQNGRFAGWGLDGRAAGAIATADGIGPGVTRARLDDAFGPPLAVRQSSLGTEFSAGPLNGLLDGPGPSARITDMWTGVSCVAR